MEGAASTSPTTSLTTTASTVSFASLASTASTASCSPLSAVSGVAPLRQLPTTRAASGVDFYTQLAYPLFELNAHTRVRDEGAERRRLVRSALTAATAWQSDASALLAAAEDVLNTRSGGAQVCLVGVRARRAQRGDAGRDDVVAVREDPTSRSVFVDPGLSPNKSDDATPPMTPMIVLHSKDADANTETRLQIETPDLGVVRLSLMTRDSDAEQKWVNANSAESRVEIDVLVAMFAPMAAALPPRLLPMVEGELPEVLMAHLADFWQRCARAHLLVEHCALQKPGAHTINRLVFERMEVRRDTTEQRNAVLRCTLHAGCLGCQARDGKLKVELLLIVCGRARASGGGACNRHACPPSFDIAPSTCCANLRAELVGPRDLCIRLGLNADAQNRAAALVDAAMRFGDAMTKVGVDQQRDRESALQHAGECVVTRLEHALAKLEPLPEESDLRARDVTARELLRRDPSTGVVRQTARTLTRAPSLALYAPDGSRKALPRTQKYAGVVATHLGLFPPPPALRFKRKCA